MIIENDKEILMYCKNCGKLIETEDDFCLECKSKINKRKKSSLFLAILSVVMIHLAVILCAAGLLLALYALFAMSQTLANIFMLLAVLAFLSIMASGVLGLISIINYKQSKKSGVKLPTAVFVLGLISTIETSIFIIYDVFWMIYYLLV